MTVETRVCPISPPNSIKIREMIGVLLRGDTSALPICLQRRNNQPSPHDRFDGNEPNDEAGASRREEKEQARQVKLLAARAMELQSCGLA